MAEQNEAEALMQKKSPESAAHRAVQDLALEAENSVEQMLRLVDRLHRAERQVPLEKTPENADSPSAVPQNPPPVARLDWAKCLETFAVLHPKCKKEYVEQFRLLRARVSLAKRNWEAAGSPLQVVTVLSASAKDGKSFVASNLAAALALGSDDKVLLIDLNHVSNELSASLGFTKGAGAAEVVRTLDWEPAVRKAGETNLYVMAAGNGSDGRLDGIDFRRLPMLLETLRKSFQWIILDGPAHADSSDAELLANYCDANLLVVQKQKTEFSGISRLLECIPEGRLLGAVMNAQTLRPARRWFGMSA